MNAEQIVAYRCFDGAYLFISYGPSYPSGIKGRLMGRRPVNVRSAIESMLMTALATPFSYWVTISLDSGADVEEFRRWRTRHYPDMRYVEVAMQSFGREDCPHPNDERWHIHMLADSIPDDDLAPQMAIVPYGAIPWKQKAKDSYRWVPVQAHFGGQPKMTDVQRLGSLTWSGEPILQAGKAIYMARQYETAQPSVFAPGRRLYSVSHGLVKTLPRIGQGTITPEARAELFGCYDAYPFGLPGSFGSYASTAGARSDWRDTLVAVTEKYPSTNFSSPTIAPPGAPF